MIAASRRSFITGFMALVAAPAIVRAGSLMPVNSELVPGVSMRELTEYVPGDALVRLDVLYGRVRLGDIVTWGPVEPQCDLRQFVVTATDDKVLEDARRMYSFNNEADRERFYANWEADYAFMNGEQWDEWTKLDVPIKVRRKPQIPDSLALAAAAVAIAPVVLAKPVTRRFCGK